MAWMRFIINSLLFAFDRVTGANWVLLQKKKKKTLARSLKRALSHAFILIDINGASSQRRLAEPNDGQVLCKQQQRLAPLKFLSAFRWHRVADPPSSRLVLSRVGRR